MAKNSSKKKSVVKLTLSEQLFNLTDRVAAAEAKVDALESKHETLDKFTEAIVNTLENPDGVWDRISKVEKRLDGVTAKVEPKPAPITVKEVWEMLKKYTWREMVSYYQLTDALNKRFGLWE